MEDKEAIKVLTQMMKEHSLTEKEKEAISTSIGILSWTMLYKSRIEKLKKSQKEKRDPNFDVTRGINPRDLG